MLKLFSLVQYIVASDAIESSTGHSSAAGEAKFNIVDLASLKGQHVRKGHGHPGPRLRSASRAVFDKTLDKLELPCSRWTSGIADGITGGSPEPFATGTSVAQRAYARAVDALRELSSRPLRRQSSSLSSLRGINVYLAQRLPLSGPRANSGRLPTKERELKSLRI